MMEEETEVVGAYGWSYKASLKDFNRSVGISKDKKGTVM